MATYQTILPPPQSVDSLDAWGGLDALPWSLDSGVWLRAGVYGILAAESAQSADILKKWTRIRTSDLLQGVAAGGEAEGNIIRDLVISDTIRMDGDQIGGVARVIPIAPLHAESGESLVPYRVRADEPESKAQSEESLTPFRVRVFVLVDSSESRDDLILYRIRPLLAEADVLSGATVFPEYKGWEWQVKDNPESALWNRPMEGYQNWKQQASGNALWRGVVQWQ